MQLLRNVYKCNTPTSRSFFGALNVIFNRVNEKRIKEVGPDRACAEWLMRNGAHVRWKGASSIVPHYNMLPLDPGDQGQYFIEEIVANNASISHHGFDHFHGCHCITTISFDKCDNINDKCLSQLCILADSLLHLEIARCHNICGGLKHLAALKNLEVLKLCELEGVIALDKDIEQLKCELPNCCICKE